MKSLSTDWPDRKTANHSDRLVGTDEVASEEGTQSPQPETEFSLLDLTVLLVANKRFIGRFVLAAAIFATLVAFLLPIRYEAKVILLPPTQNTSMASALLGQLGNLGSLGSLASLGGLAMKTPNDMYVAFLTSRTVEDAMIRRFGLMADQRWAYPHRHRGSRTPSCRRVSEWLCR
jgi:hypothetical protein